MCVPAGVARKVWYLGMTARAARSTVRDAANVLFSYCLNGLRESSVLSLEAAAMDVTEYSMTVQLCIDKSKLASQ